MLNTNISQIDRLNAFCKDTDAYLEGRSGGPLSNMTFAAKDIFDIKGFVTGGGNPDWKATQNPAEQTAWAVQMLVDAGAAMVGKTLTDEITRGIFGENARGKSTILSIGTYSVPGTLLYLILLPSSAIKGL